MEDDFKGLMKQSLLISITHMSRRIKELLKLVEGDWKQSKLSGAAAIFSI
jgi:hypothetical protein